MTFRTSVIGTLGLALAMVWAAALLYQWQSLDLLVGALMATSSGYWIKASSLWSLVQLVASGLLVVPVVVASIAAILGAKIVLKALRVAVSFTTLLSVGSLVIYAIVVAPIVVSGGPLLPFGERIDFDLLATASALIVQVGLLALLRWESTRGGGNQPSTTKDGGQMRNTAPQPPSRETRLTGSQPPLVARG
jgi:hypothetical protein